MAKPHKTLYSYTTSPIRCQGLLAWYPGGPQNGRRLVNRAPSGGRYNGTFSSLVSSTTSGWVPSLESGREALRFDGIDDYVNLGDNFGGLAAMTVMAWYYVAVAPNVNGLSPYNVVAKASNNSLFSGIAFEVYYDNNFQFVLGGPNATVSAGAIPIQQMWHIAFTYNGATMLAYKNGIQVGSQAATGTINALAGVTSRIGVSESVSFNGFYNGTIQELHIYNRALTRSEIMQHVYPQSRWQRRYQTSRRKPLFATSSAAPQVSTGGEFQETVQMHQPEKRVIAY